MTMGIGSIMRSKKILLIATGESKAKAIKAMVSGEITPQIPCSILNEHKDVVIMHYIYDLCAAVIFTRKPRPNIDKL